MHRRFLASCLETPAWTPIVQPRLHVMPLQFKSLYQLLFLALAAQTAGAADRVSAGVKPSDCKPRDADSTCATAVAGGTVTEPSRRLDGILYDGPLGGVPSSGYAYWGFDFFSDEWGYPSSVRQDEFINRSKVPVTIKLSFIIPTNHPCRNDCLPGVQFQVDLGWFKVDPPYVIDGNKVAVTSTFKPGEGFGWVIALWQSTNPRLTITVPKDATATLADVGMSAFPAVANEIAATTTVCTCWDGSTAACSYGRRFSNGLLGSWDQHNMGYARQGAFSDCRIDGP